MKRSTKQFVISSEAKNDKGFRVRTSGIDLTDYNANPLMLFMHQRPTGKSKDEVLPIGSMLDIELKDNKLYGVPAFDDTDDFAIKLFNKVENGTLKMMSAGLLPLEFSQDKKTGDVWLEKSKLKEVSLVDIGSNAEALAVTLYNEKDEVLNLSLETIREQLKPTHTMKLIELSASAVLPLLQLSADATPEATQEAIGNLVTLAADQKKAIETLTTERDDFKTKYNDGVKLAQEAKITSLLDAAEADVKFVKGDRAKWEKLAQSDFESTKDILDSMQASTPVSVQLKKDAPSDALTKLSYEELDKSGQLMTLKAEHPEAFKEKFKAKFGTDYKEN